MSTQSTTRVYGRFPGKLLEEADCFDRQIRQRVTHGYIPDLRRMGRNEWFRNNVWRDPVFADMLYGNIVRQILSALKKYTHKALSEIDLIEIACGPGHLTLELSRNGCNATGLDISYECIQLARQTAEHDPYLDTRGSLDYVCDDFFAFEPDKKFDMVIFSCALHHFGDLSITLKKADRLLKAGGLIFVSEPTKIQLTNAQAAVIHLVRCLLSMAGNYFEEVIVPENKKQLRQSLAQIKREFGYLDDSDNNVQSPMDNISSYSQMYSALRKHFQELETGADFGFFDRIVAGLRLKSSEHEYLTAKWLFEIDRLLCSSGFFAPQQFHFIGRKLTQK